MEFYDFPTIYSVLKQHGAVEQTADQFYARSIVGCVGLLPGHRR